MEQQNEKYLAHLGKMQRPIPGSSLTNDPEQPLPFEQAPEFTKKKDALDEIFLNMTRPEIYGPLMEAIGGQSTVMEATQVILMEGFRQGKWNPDLFLMLIEPTAYMTMALAERAGIEYTVDREQDEEDITEQDPKIEKRFEALSRRIKKNPSDSGALPKDIEKKIEELPVESLLAKPKPEQDSESLLSDPRTRIQDSTMTDTRMEGMMNGGQ